MRAHIGLLGAEGTTINRCSENSNSKVAFNFLRQYDNVINQIAQFVLSSMRKLTATNCKLSMVVRETPGNQCRASNAQ
jgi:hypothetical protein